MRKTVRLQKLRQQSQQPNLIEVNDEGNRGQQASSGSAAVTGTCRARISNVMELKMPKRIAALIVCFVLVGVGSGGEKTPGFLGSLQTHTWEVGAEISHIKYKEPGVMEEEGTMYGLIGSYTYRDWVRPDSEVSDGGRMLRLEGRYSWGEVDYDGSITGETPYTVSDVDDYLLEFRLLAGNDAVTSKGMNTGYLGFGYRYLNDDASFDPYGYERESNYFYMPFGIQTTNDLGDGLSFGLAGEFDLLLFGIQVSHLSDVDPSYDDVKNFQWLGFGLRGSTKLQKKTKHLDIIVEPFIRYWWVEESDPQYIDGAIVWEPRNRSLEYGIHLLFRF